MRSEGHSRRPFPKPVLLFGALAILGVLAALLALGRAAAIPGDTVADQVFGQGGSFTSGNCNLGNGVGGPASAASLCVPIGVALDAAGDLYVGDYGNNRVLEYDTPLATDTVADRVFGQGGSFTSNTCQL